MKTPIIADTSALISLASITDQNHILARKTSLFVKRGDYSLIVPGEIVTETTNTLGKKISHKIAIYTAVTLIGSNELAIIETTSNIRKEALELFKRQSESVSFTDCLVMVFADTFKTELIFGFDEAFKKNGYVRVGIDDTE